MNNLYIDICVPFFLYNQCPLRMYITELILYHYQYIINHCKEKMNTEITMTFIGSEKEISKNFISKHFQCEYTYHEFEQGNIKVGYNQHFLNMLTQKFRFAFQKSMEKKPNISLLAGSNDYISLNFFEQIIQYYKPDNDQLFGIDNFYNGENKTTLDCFDGKNFLSELIWSTGFSNYANRQKYKYIGGIIGFNNTLYNKYYHQLMNNIISYDEGEIEYKTLQLSNIDKFNSKEVYFINIKTKNSSEITPFDILKKNNKSEILSFSSFPTNFQSTFLIQYNKFIKKNTFNNTIN